MLNETTVYRIRLVDHKNHQTYVKDNKGFMEFGNRPIAEIMASSWRATNQYKSVKVVECLKQLKDNRLIIEPKI